jgi:hypothetical protein
MRVRILLTTAFFPLAVASTVSAAEQCNPDCTHPTKACVCAIDSPSGRVALTPIGDIRRQPLAVGQALEIGDELLSGSADTLVTVTCAGGSELKLQGIFRTVIMPAEPGQDCAFNLLAGSADIMTDEPTELASGETLMGSKRTLYGMRVSRSDEGSKVECVVFEGEAEVRNVKLGRTTEIGTSSRAAWRNGVLAEPVGRVSDKDVESATRLYARADVARARAKGVSIDQPERFERALQERYLAVFNRPQDAAARIELARLQTTAQIARPALYHLARAEKLEPSQPEQRVAIATTKVRAYEQLGRTKEAEAETAKLRKIDPSKLRSMDERLAAGERSRERDTGTAPAPTQPAPPPPVVTRPRPPGAVTEKSLRRIAVRATASPSVIDVGRPTTITVTVTLQDGAPVPGAAVTVAAGGGSFRGSKETRVQGVTDANGVFRTAWLCTQCAPAYGIDVSATAEGLPTAQTSLTVRIR